MNRSKVMRVIVALLAGAPVVTVTAVALSSSRHAALAYSEARHVHGFAKDQPTQQAAESMALELCGEGCTIRLHWEGGCGAYAQDENHIHFGWTVAPSKSEAEKRAVATCKKLGGTHCALRDWGCE